MSGERPVLMVKVYSKRFEEFASVFEQSFDGIMTGTIEHTMLGLCESIPGCTLGYCYGGVILLMISDYKRYKESELFKYDVHDLCCILASKATLLFHKWLEAFTQDYVSIMRNKLSLESVECVDLLYKTLEEGITFVANTWNCIDGDEETSFVWQQMCARQHSIKTLAHGYFAEEDLVGKSSDDVVAMLYQKGVIWDKLPDYQKWGSCAVETVYEGENYEPEAGQHKSVWEIDRNVPVFDGEGLEYIRSKREYATRVSSF